jgi:anti-anti-sigma factor
MSEVVVQSDGGSRYIISSPDLREWHTRVDLVGALVVAAGERPVDAVILDMDRVSSVSSAGLGAIFALRKFMVGRGAKVVVARPAAALRRLFHTVNLGALVPIVPTLADARALMDGRPAAQTPPGASV